MILAGDEEPQARQGVAAGFRHALMKAGDGGKQKSSGVKSFVQITQDLKPYMGQ